jgi:hypothetical protein
MAIRVRRVSRCTLLIAALGAATGSAAIAQDVHLLPGVREFPADTITDVAITVEDSAGPIIYYNPQRSQRYGPALTRFFIAHEYGHIYHRHSRAAVLAADGEGRKTLSRGQELEADCFAATRLAQRDRPAVEAAIRFFTRLGPFSFDGMHPTGAQRVARILECLPDPAGTTVEARRNGDTGMETGPVGGVAERIRFTVAATNANEGRDIALWIDGQPMGRISNMRLPGVLAVDRFAAGLHSYRLHVDLFGMDELMQFSPSGSVSGTGYIAVKDGDSFLVDWATGRSPGLVPGSHQGPAGSE